MIKKKRKKKIHVNIKMDWQNFCKLYKVSSEENSSISSFKALHGLMLTFLLKKNNNTGPIPIEFEYKEPACAPLTHLIFISILVLNLSLHYIEVV